jgi:hypothetical protein
MRRVTSQCDSSQGGEILARNLHRLAVQDARQGSRGDRCTGSEEARSTRVPQYRFSESAGPTLGLNPANQAAEGVVVAALIQSIVCLRPTRNGVSDIKPNSRLARSTFSFRRG